MAGQGNPFTRGTVLVLILVGTAAFLGLLYGLGSGDFGPDEGNGSGHAVSDSLIGYTAFAEILEQSGSEVDVTRSPAQFDENNLLVVTPSLFTTGEQLTELFRQRTYIGPTMVIMPKWFARRDSNLKTGWVRLLSTVPFNALESDFDIVSAPIAGVSDASGAGSNVRRNSAGLRSGYAVAGKSPDDLAILQGDYIHPMVRDVQSGSTIIGYMDDGGYYPMLDGLAPRQYSDDEFEDMDFDRYPVILVSDPDLFNNMGMADKVTALHALSVIAAIDDGDGWPIVFDLTFNGLGSSENLLSLAFRPPFLAATICFLIAAVVVGWMTFVRFAPPIVSGRSIGFGKTALVRNSSAMLKLMSRQHLLRAPYLAMVRRKAARSLGLSPTLDEDALNEQLDRITDEQVPPFSVLQNKLLKAHKPDDIAKAAAQIDKWKKDNL